MAGRDPSGSSTTTVEHLNDKAKQLLKGSLTPATRAFYHKAWGRLLDFLALPNVSLPLSVIQIANFIGYMFDQNLKPSTITSYVSAISYVHKILLLPDPTTVFIVRKILKGCENLTPSTDSRLPITKTLLHKLISILPSVFQQHYHQLLLKTLFLVAFNGFFRLGELVIRTKQGADKVLQRQDLNFTFDSSIVSTLQGAELTLRCFKNNKSNKPFTIFLSALHDKTFCPAHSLYEYTQSFKHQNGPLFQFTNGLPVTVQFVTDSLKKLLLFLGIDPTPYKGHSFRIGAATNAACQGYSEQSIQKLGRWNSNALQRYIRINSVQL